MLKYYGGSDNVDEDEELEITETSKLKSFFVKSSNHITHMCLYPIRIFQKKVKAKSSSPLKYILYIFLTLFFEENMYRY